MLITLHHLRGWSLLLAMLPAVVDARVIGTHIYNRHKAENRVYEQDAMDGGSFEPLHAPKKKMPEIDEDASYDERASQLRRWLNERAVQRNPQHAERHAEGLAGEKVDVPYVGHGHHHAAHQQGVRHGYAHHQTQALHLHTRGGHAAAPVSREASDLKHHADAGKKRSDVNAAAGAGRIKPVKAFSQPARSGTGARHSRTLRNSG